MKTLLKETRPIDNADHCLRRLLVMVAALVGLLMLVVLAWLYIPMLPDWGAGDPVRAWCSPDHSGNELYHGYVDIEGKWAVQPICYQVSEYSEGLAYVSDAPFTFQLRHPAYLNTKGKVAFDKLVMKDGAVVPGTGWAVPTDFHDGLAALELLDLKRPTIFFDRTGHEVFQMADLDHESWVKSPSIVFSEGLATVKQKGKMGVIDRTGRWAISPSTELPFSFIGPFHHGLAVAARSGGGAGIINGKGETVVPLEHTSVSALGNDRFLVSKAGKDGVIDARSRWAVPLSSRQLWPAGGERCQLYCREEGTLMDGEGKMLFKTTLKLEGRFSEGLCIVSDPAGKEARGYMNEQGRVVFRLPRDITRIDPFHHGLAKVGKVMDRGAVYSALVNKQGKIVIEDVNGP